ncbi:DUF5689 domain-containing protein [Subsaxibacter sp. CAU 1640]|uniref:DUF5689 domain-containing protein n=1 Tax=Subsaxibacter sp. CAU 1640 TaxID=2933271 RepID=UPI0020050FF2|nr:DUF5689 domain-containing protein [Subsaxibacter sp. CAU 1640]MCK7589351.1 DUF5689 domain-containing protein [Subsaxibacter sp. CAU 1640]
MKTNKIFKLFTIIAMTFAMTSCVQDDDFSVPTELGTEENAGLRALLASNASEVTIAELKAMYLTESDPGDNAPVFVETDIYVKGYVSSSDRTGNFYKEMFLQDSPENPTSAIKVIFNQVESYNQYNFGREVYINLKGLYVGEERLENEVITIGGGTETDNFGTTVTQMTNNQRAAKMFRSENTFEMVPLNKTFAGVSSDDIGLYVKFDGVQFADNLNGLRYFDPMEDFDTSRTLQTCAGFGYSNFILETSSFASFANELLPTGNGNISGVITKTFEGDVLILTLNTTEDVNMDGQRCEPLNIDDFTVVFEDGFSTGISNWTTFNALGAQVWGQTNFGNPAPSAYMNGFQSGAQNNEDWLISPAIDLSSVTNTVFFFETDKRYDGNDLEVYYSTNYSGTGNPNTNGTWTQLDAIIDPNAGAWNTWTNSGTIDISSADGQTVYIAFKYTSTTSAAATFELDNVAVLGL